MPSISRNNLIPAIVAAVAGLAILTGAGFWWADKQAFEKTDNAFVQADTVQVSPQVAGYVVEVLVNDNQHVEAGQVVARIDPTTFQARLDQAVANAAALEAAVSAVDDRAALEQAMIAQRAAGVASAKAEAGRMEADLRRYDDLAAKGWVSDQKLSTVRAGTAQSAASVAQAQAALEAERRAAESLGSARAQTVAQVAAARAAVEQARLDLERTIIRAPAAGVVGARSVRPGQLVQPGMALMSVVPLGQTFIVANFKETQMARLRIGQRVQVHADAFGDETITGRVQSFAPATGQEFALIPVENAVGNFTKVTQRVPVRIVIDRDARFGGGLRPGLSVSVKVDVRDRSGLSFAESAAGSAQLARRGESH
ncbi:MAG: HlyD family secretion protein [Caulobacter sp.]|nr:HlyD family secretion protein [Caulobacter sp.]